MLSIKIQRQVLVLLGLFFLAVLLPSCGADNMTDAVTRKKDIERESASQLAQDYEQIAGEYASDSSESEYPVRASLQVVRVQHDGSLVPQPTITGSLTVTETPAPMSTSRLESAIGKPPSQANPRSPRTMSTDADPETVIPFSTGVYDPASKDLAIRISGFTAPGANVSCKVKLPKIKCQWVPVGSGLRFHFSLLKTT